ncbi:hypothetical protein DWY78_02290 [Ruminococcus sp. AF27-12AA]|nr:hypothetical protein DWY78_02290 [Ruminococcus sp. AF27-12AA]
MQVKFDEVLIPEEKLNRVVAESMDEIYKGCKKKKSYQRFLYRIAALIGIIILSGSLVISNASVLPVLAEKSSFFKKIFEKVQGESSIVVIMIKMRFKQTVLQVRLQRI